MTGGRPPRGNGAGPGNDKGHAAPALPDAVFAAPVRTRGAVIAVQFRASVVIAVKEHRTVVARKNDQGILQQVVLFQGLNDLADIPVQLHHDISADPQRSRSLEARMRQARHMILMCRIEKEKRLLLMLVDELQAPSREKRRSFPHRSNAPRGRRSSNQCAPPRRQSCRSAARPTGHGVSADAISQSAHYRSAP
jgi:hypothetical protein